MDGCVQFDNTIVTSTQYADDLKLFARTPEALTHLYQEVEFYLNVFGLTTSVAKAHVM